MMRALGGTLMIWWDICLFDNLICWIIQVHDNTINIIQLQWICVHKVQISLYMYNVIYHEIFC